jgi:hypothetical protein
MALHKIPWLFIVTIQVPLIFSRIQFCILAPSTYIRHHLLHDLVESQVVSLFFVPTHNQMADILTIPLDGRRFESLRKAIGAYDMSSNMLGLDFSVFLSLFC